MNAYTINQQLDSLYKDLEAAHNNDEEAVCLMFNADSKKEAIQLITDEIDSLEDALKGFETCEDDGMDYDALCRVQVSADTHNTRLCNARQPYRRIERQPIARIG